MITKTRAYDAGLITSGTLQASVLDIPNVIWQDLLQSPIQTMVGILTIILILVRIIRVAQKIRINKNGRLE